MSAQSNQGRPRHQVMVAIVLSCHYMSAFAALGMPLFLPIMLQELGAPLQSRWIGLLFILPTLMTAIAAKYWGRFADSYGRKTSLLRAEIGLAAGFLICGFSQTLWQLMLGLTIQGLFGGTMAASNAYLAASITNINALKQVLNYTQFSARLALITAPIGLGFLVHYFDVLSLYRWLAIMPLLAFVLSSTLRKDSTAAASLREAKSASLPHPQHQGNSPSALPIAQASGRQTAERTGKQAGKQTSKPASKPQQNKLKLSKVETRPYLFIATLQFFLAFCMVATFPYFLPFAARFDLTPSQIGQLYAFPHAIYLVCQLLCGRQRIIPPSSLIPGFTVLAVAVLLHLLPQLPVIWLARVLFGVGMFMCYYSLHTQMANTNRPQHSGKIFSRYDALSKWGGVLAGFAVTLFVPLFGLLAPFVISAVMALIAVLTILIYQRYIDNRYYPDEPLVNTK